MADIVLYGGTFNPIHNGHAGLCRYVLRELGFSRVLLIPAASPPHKEAPALAPSGDRLAICRLATGDLSGVEVLDWEISRGGRSYTIDTVNYLAGQFPNDRLFLLMGSDMFVTFRQWRDWRGIGKRVTLLVASRETDDRYILAEQQQSLAADGVATQILENPVMPLSSTELRALLAEGKGFELLPAGVAEYIREQGMYGCGYNLAKLRETVKPLMTPDRYHHSLCVERQAVHLARLYSVEVNKAAAAGILHDICKNMPRGVLLQMLQNSATMIDIDFEKQPQLMHGFAGAVYIRDKLGITDVDILNAVGYHTTARAHMSLLEQIIYLADLTSRERDYREVDDLRALTEQSLQGAMLASLTNMVNEYLPSIGVTAGRDTAAALAQYQNLMNTK